MNSGEGYEFALRSLGERFDEIEFVVYIRKQDDFFLSSWLQWIYHQGQSFESFVEERLKSLYPNYYRSVLKLLEIVPRSQMQVVPLVSQALTGDELISDFLERVGSKLKTIDGYADTNKALNPYICEAFSRLGCLQTEPFSNRTRVLLEEYGDKDFLFTRHPEFVDYKTRSRILNAFDESNRLLHAEWFPHLGFDDIFSVDESIREIELNNPGFRVAREKEVIAFLADLSIRLMAKME